MPVLSKPLRPSVDRVYGELNSQGFACLENVVSPEWMERARGHVQGLIERHGAKFFSIIRPGDEAGSPLREMAIDPEVVGLMSELAARARPAAPQEEGEVYNVLRVIAGPKGESGSLQFHYDQSTVTMLIPVFMPGQGAGRSGELVVFPNQRPFRRSLVVNLLEKALLQNRFARRRYAQQVPHNERDLVRLLYPGNIYLFWGYRSYHGNLPCAPNSLRATMLLHYGNPHAGSRVLAGVRAGRKAVELLRRKLA